MHPILALLSPLEFFLIIGALLLLFGANKLPDLARGMGKSVTEFKKARRESEAEIAETEKKR